MSANLIQFGVFTNQIIGTLVKAKDLTDLLENKMTKRLKEFWSEIKFKDEHGQSIQITREFFQEQKMSIDEIIEDWKQHGILDDEIVVLNPKGNGTLTF